MTPAPLPKFNKPPVTEVALGVQFRPLTFTGPALGALWETLRSKFPLIEEQPPLLPITDDFGPPRPPQFNIEMGGQPLLSRYWFISEDRSRLLQLQRDRLVFNWRREGVDSAYPHYEAIRTDFNVCFDAVKHFAGTHLGDSVEPTWAEATYVNLIRPNAVWKTLAELDKVFTLIRRPDLSTMPALTDIAATWRYLLMDQDDQAYGRLVVSVQPGFDPADASPLLNLTLAARGLVGADDCENLRFLDTAREVIVRGFADITTKEMHDTWERTQ